MRYASFVDLLRVAYGNLVNLGLALAVDMFLHTLPVRIFVYFNTTSIFLIFIFATLLMWALRVFVKTLYDVAFSNTRAIRVLIYGAMTGGVGLAKMIKNQRPRRYVVKGFITHYQKARHSHIMGEKVFTMDDDLSDIIKKEILSVSSFHHTVLQNSVIIRPFRM